MAGNEGKSLDELKSLETLCRLNEQKLKFQDKNLDLLRTENQERSQREEAANNRLEATLSRLFGKIDEVKAEMGNFREEIDARVEKCSEKMDKKINATYVTKVELAIMTQRITSRITWIGALITVAILVAKFLFPGAVI